MEKINTNNPQFMGLFLVLYLSLLLAACGESDATSHSRYICPGNLWIDVTFRGGKEVEVNMEGHRVVLPRIKSTSGSKYESHDGQLFWAMGKDAQFSEKPGSAPINCQRR